MSTSRLEELQGSAEDARHLPRTACRCQRPTVHSSSTDASASIKGGSLVLLGAGVLHCGEVATAHGRALQDKRKKVKEEQWPGLTKQQAREGGAWKLTRDYQHSGPNDRCQAAPPSLPKRGTRN